MVEFQHEMLRNSSKICRLVRDKSWIYMEKNSI